jgi:hypothetical protein
MQAFANTTILVGPNAPTCLSRGETKQATDQITVAMLDLCQGNADTEYTQHRRCVEQRIHALMHEGIGPTMWLLATSPGDPVFFMHHGFVDWQWKRWQDVNGTRSTESKSSLAPEFSVLPSRESANRSCIKQFPAAQSTRAMVPRASP